MKYLLYGAAAIAFVFAAQGLPAIASERDDVLSAESAINTAVVQHDVSAADKLLTSDYTLVIGAGKMYDRASFLKLVGDRSVVYSTNQPHDESVRLYGDTTAVIVGVLDVRGTAGSHAFAYHLRYTDTWIKLNGAWQQAAAHSTDMPSE